MSPAAAFSQWCARSKACPTAKLDLGLVLSSLSRPRPAGKQHLFLPLVPWTNLPHTPPAPKFTPQDLLVGGGTLEEEEA